MRVCGACVCGACVCMWSMRVCGACVCGACVCVEHACVWSMLIDSSRVSPHELSSDIYCLVAILAEVPPPPSQISHHKLSTHTNFILPSYSAPTTHTPCTHTHTMHTHTHHAHTHHAHTCQKTFADPLRTAGSASAVSLASSLRIASNCWGVGPPASLAVRWLRWIPIPSTQTSLAGACLSRACSSRTLNTPLVGTALTIVVIVCNHGRGRW